MESIIIGPDRMKIMLSGEELKGYGLHKERDIDSSLTGTVLRKILRDAGFEGAPARLHVQVYDLGNGGCEMYVAVLPEVLVDAEDIEATSVVVKRRDDLIGLMERLSGIGYDVPISIYKDNAFTYALFESSPPDFVGDYGRIEGKEKIPYILEYATPVCVKITAEGFHDYL